MCPSRRACPGGDDDDDDDRGKSKNKGKAKGKNKSKAQPPGHAKARGVGHQIGKGKGHQKFGDHAAEHEDTPAFGEDTAREDELVALKAEYEREIAAIQAEYDRELAQIQAEFDREVAEAEREGRKRKAENARLRFEYKLDELNRRTAEKQRERTRWLEEKIAALEDREGVEICWSPTGREEDRATRRVSRAAVDHYLEMGATLGRCGLSLPDDEPAPPWTPAPVPGQPPVIGLPEIRLPTTDEVLEKVLERLPPLGMPRTPDIIIRDAVERQALRTAAEADALLAELLSGSR